MSHDYLSSPIDDYTDEDASEVFVKRNGILQKISGKEKKKIVANLKKKGIQKKGKLIEDNNDERDNYEVIDHTKLSPEQERNKPEHTWQKPRRD